MCRLTMTAILFSILALGGCAHVMSEANLKLVDRSISFEDLKKHPESLAGKTVMAGGIVVSADSSGDVTMLEVAQLELTGNGVPDEDIRSGGRFLAISSGLLDPVIYRTGRLVTIIGEVKGKKVQAMHGVDYPYPLISVKEVRLFSEPERLPDYHVNPYQNTIDYRKDLLKPPGPAEGEPKRLY